MGVFDTYVSKSEYKNVQNKVLRTPTVAEAQRTAAQKRSIFKSYTQQQAAPPTFSPATEEPNWFEQGLEYISRPLQAIASGTSEALQGRDFFQGAWQGLQGQGPARTFSDVLANQGVGDLGELSFGPFSVKGRDVIGFIGDVAADPLTWAGAGIGKAVSLGAKATTAGKAVTTAAEFGKVKPWAEVMTKNTRTTLSHRLGDIPGVRRIVNLVDPTAVREGPVKAGLLGVGSQYSDIDARLIPQIRARFSTTPLKVKGGKIVLSDGTEEAWNDVFENLGKFRDKLSPEQTRYIEDYRAFTSELVEWGEKNGINWDKKLTSSDPDWQWIHRRVIDTGRPAAPKQYVMLRHSKKMGKTMSSEKERGFEKAATGIEKGVTYDDPLNTLLELGRDVNRKVVDLQFRNWLVESGAATVKDVGAISEAMKPIISLKAELDALKRLAGVANDAKMGKTIKPQTLNMLDKIDPSIASDIRQALSIEIPKATELLEHMSAADKELYKDVINWLGYMGVYFSERGAKEIGQPLTEVTFDAIVGAMEKFNLSVQQRSRFVRDILKGEFKASTAERKSLLDDAIKKIQMKQDSVRLRLEPVRATYRGVKQAEYKKIQGLQSTAQPALKELYFNPQDAKRITDFLHDSAQSFVKKAGKIGQWSRVATTGADFGGAMIQGLPFLAMHPTQWAKATMRSIQAFADPGYVNRYIQENSELISKLRGLGIGHDVAEMYEATAPIQNRAFRQTFGRFQTSYETFGTVARVEMAKGLMPIWEKSGRSLDTLVDFLNQSTGYMSTKAIGVSATQREAENAFLFFAPRYLRASLAMVLDATTDTSLKGWQARRALGAMMAGGIAQYMHVCTLTGQEPQLDPSDGRFMTLQVGNDRVGIGSIWMSLARLAGNITDDAASMGAGFPWDPEEWRKNPLMMWTRSRGAPLTTTAIDLLSGESYIGEEIKDAGSFLKYLGGKMMPFAMESKLLQTPTSDIASTPFEVLGMRTFPQNYTDRRKMEAEKLLKERGLPAQPYEEMDPFLQQEADRRTQALGLPIKGEFTKARDEIFTKQETRLQQIQQQLQSGAINKNNYREMRNTIKYETAIELGTVDNQESERDREKRVASMTPREQARQQYYEILRTKDEYGQPNWDEAESFLSSLPKEYQQYITDTSEAKLDSLPPEVAKVEKELFRARQKLQKYWEIFDIVMTKNGMLNKYRSMTPAQRDEWRKSDQGKKIFAQIAKERKNMRKSNSIIDKLLVEWYGLTPISEQG